MATKTDRITVRLPTSMIQNMDTLVGLETYRNRTDIVYRALQHFLREQGSKATETVEAEKGMLKLRQLSAEMEAVKAKMAAFLD